MTVVADIRPFSTLQTIDGFDVIDERGRTLDHRSTQREAQGVAFHLNNVLAGSGPKALEKALRGGVFTP